MNISDHISNLKKLNKQYVKELNPTEKHFEVGDTAYICVEPFKTIEVVITEIQDFSENGNKPGGLIYYWFHYKKIPKIKNILYKIYSYFFWNIIYKLPFLNKKILYKYSPTIPDYLGVGHAVLAGQGELLFKNKDEAIFDYEFSWLYYHLDNIEYLLKNNYS